MALAAAVQGARHTGQAITWTRADGTAQNLTGATLTGRIRDSSTGTARNVDGTLTITSAAAGQFTWAYGALDVGTAGSFTVQFVATYASSSKNDKTLDTPWTVIPAL